jgi:hypothetical protein
MSTEALGTYVVECYQPRLQAAGLAATVRRARRAAAAVSRGDNPVRHLRLLYVAEEETCFHLYEARSAEAVAEACVRAELPADRIVEASVVEPTDLKTKEIA